MTLRATYRLQFNKDFGFRDAAKIAPYLRKLGISHVYASPWLKARPGSSHGYDIVDHHELNPELGSQEDFDAMIVAFHAEGLGQILDFVPNHMGVGGADNPLWLDVLEWGPDSNYAGWFDIDWRPDRQYLRNKVLVPFLGNQYGVELYDGKLRLHFDERDGTFAVWAYEVHKLPICPLHYGRILSRAHRELENLGDAFANLPDWRPQIGRRADQLKRELAEFARANSRVYDAISEAVEQLNGTAGDEDSWRPLNTLIQEQHWRIADFRVAADDINYRRFFNINELAGLRMELSDVFDHAHSLVFRLIDEGKVDGLRIDHVDGLLDPKHYLQRLRGSTAKPFYLAVEKILAHHENLREDWETEGTTGYEFANLVLGLLIDPRSAESFTKTYVNFTDERKTFPEIVRECKIGIMRNEMTSELDVLAREVTRVAHQNPRTADFTHNVLRRALREVVACFPVYRTYLDSSSVPSEEDRRYLTWALKQARSNEKDLDPSIFDFLEKVLSTDLLGDGGSGFSRQAVLRCAMKLQQYCGPVMAKGLEDTAFYRYNRFIALNEVGGDPALFGVSVAAFHKANAQRAKRWPKSLLTTSTHDTKRGEDSRARLAVLSEMPDEWAAQVDAWSRIVRARSGDIEAMAPPDRNDEYFFYQILVGSWPAELTTCENLRDSEMWRGYVDRLKVAMTKSMREAKVHSTWASPNLGYESAVLSFIDGVLDPERSSAFFATFLPFQERIARLGTANSLVQTALKLTSPGMPDLYQGSDLWDLSLVDPDNRRLVDYDHRAKMLSQLEPPPPVGDLLARWQDGAVKLFVTTAILRFRCAEPELFALGEYEALVVTGHKSDLVCAFSRHYNGKRVAVLAARFPARRELDSDWSGLEIAVQGFSGTTKLRDVVTRETIVLRDGKIDAADAFRTLPVAILTT